VILSSVKKTFNASGFFVGRLLLLLL